MRFKSDQFRTGANKGAAVELMVCADDEWIKTHRAAAILGLSKRRVLEYVQSGLLRSMRLRDTEAGQVAVVVVRAEVERLRNERENPAPLNAPYAGKVASSATRLRQEIGAAAGWTCIYCQKTGNESLGPDHRVWHVDHLFAEARGGDSLSDNLVLACATCNLQKNHRLASEVLALRRQILREALAR